MYHGMRRDLEVRDSVFEGDLRVRDREDFGG